MAKITGASALALGLLLAVACDDDDGGTTDVAPGTDPAPGSPTDDGTDTGDTTDPPDDSTNGDGSGEAVDLTGAQLSNRSADCADYVAAYTSSVNDVQASVAYMGTVTIEVVGTKCVITSNSIPNHDFNDGASSFVTAVAESMGSYEVPASPAAAASSTALTLQYDNAIFLNGVKLDLLAAACYGVGDEPLGQEKIGCFDIDSPWRYDPMFAGNNFGTDSHNAHTQPDGTYHYHGNPRAMFADDSPTEASPVIGFAADGFPIYGPYIDDGGTIREVVSGYTLKAVRESQAGEGAFPGGTPDGTYRDDYEFTDAGDLDECNGMMRDGAYGYYVTNAYPWVMGCFTGTPDDSFRKGMP